MNLARVLVLATVVFSTWSLPAGAFLPGGEIELTLEVLYPGPGGRNRVACSRTQSIAGHAVLHWSIAWDAASFEDDRASRFTPGAADCEKKADGQAEAPEGSEVGSGQLSVGGSLSATVRRQMQDERVLEVTSDMFVPRVATDEAGSDGPEPVSEAHHSRTLNFAQGASTYIPIALCPLPVGTDCADPSGYLRLTARERLPEERLVFGKIHFAGLGENAQLSLDGFELTRPAAGRDWTLDLVEPGIHRVELQDHNGASIQRLVRVEPGRTTVAAFQSSGESVAGFALEPLGENDQGYLEYRRPKDQAIVIRIPEGEFLMGNSEAERSPKEHRVWLSEFLIDKTGVTWGQYKQFASETGTPMPAHETYWTITDRQPVVYVTWEESRAYCQWAGARLPTEAEREKAARGTDGRLYAWGNEEPSPERAVFRVSWGYGHPAEVDSHPLGASPYGALHMGGNLWEWCEDWYEKDYYDASPFENPTGPPAGTAHVVRGGSWDSRPAVLNASVRSWGHRGYRDGDFGFRCAMSIPD